MTLLLLSENNQAEFSDDLETYGLQDRTRGGVAVGTFVEEPAARDVIHAHCALAVGWLSAYCSIVHYNNSATSNINVCL